jgi:hypothetical protein
MSGNSPRRCTRRPHCARPSRCPACTSGYFDVEPFESSAESYPVHGAVLIIRLRVVSASRQFSTSNSFTASFIPTGGRKRDYNICIAGLNC